MAKTLWLPGAAHVDLSRRPYYRGNGPLNGDLLLGVCLHVNVSGSSDGTSLDFWKRNSGQVTPTAQIMRSGHVDQLLPLNWSPWCQVDGNGGFGRPGYAALETGGMPTGPFGPFTPEQEIAIARILAIFHRDYGVPLKVANHPGERGVIIHSAGGVAWGGHSCPGSIRANDRPHLIDLARAMLDPHPHNPLPVPSGGTKKPIKQREPWPSWMREGHYFGNVHGPDNVHGGVNARERSAVLAIQRRFVAEGCVPGVTGAHSTWADGLWESETDDASVRWHRKHHRGGHPKLIGPTDWRYLFTY